MSERNNILTNLRPILKKAKVLNQSSELESFQNTTLRPIIKFQHPLLILILKAYLKKSKFDHSTSTTIKLTEHINELVKKNKSMNLQITHSITSIFTTKEYLFYSNNTKEIHKRIIQIVLERFSTNLEEI